MSQTANELWALKMFKSLPSDLQQELRDHAQALREMTSGKGYELWLRYSDSLALALKDKAALDDDPAERLVAHHELRALLKMKQLPIMLVDQATAGLNDSAGTGDLPSSQADGHEAP